MQDKQAISVEELAIELKSFRTDLNLTVDEVCDVLSIGNSTYYEIINGSSGLNQRGRDAIYNAVSLSRLLTGFSKSAREFIARKEGLDYFHWTNLPDGRPMWKFHHLEFRFVRGYFTADTVSYPNAGANDDQARKYTWFLHGTDTRLAMFGRMQTQQRTSDGKVKTMAEIDGPAERFYPSIRIPPVSQDRLDTCFAGIGLWTDWAKAPKAVLSCCLLATPSVWDTVLRGEPKPETGFECSETTSRTLQQLWDQLWTERCKVHNMLATNGAFSRSLQAMSR
jgi:transcriptional regulator with XRE-family HTH domain